MRMSFGVLYGYEKHLMVTARLMTHFEPKLSWFAIARNIEIKNFLFSMGKLLDFNVYKHKGNSKG